MTGASTVSTASTGGVAGLGRLGGGFDRAGVRARLGGDLPLLGGDLAGHALVVIVAAALRAAPVAAAAATA